MCYDRGVELFDRAPAGTEAQAPLAARMRPRTLDEFVGQDHLVGPGRVLRRAIERDELTSLILYGPPGTGKTSLAHLIAAATKSAVEQVNAVTAGVADLKQVIARARDRRRFHGQRTILFIDEIHRFNKAQQDVLLPHVEEGTLVLIGATTENPFFEVNATLVSRSRVYRLEPLGDDEIRTIVQRALADGERGLGRLRVRLDEEALAHLVAVSSGDARVALNTLELAALGAPEEEEGRRVTAAMIAEVTQRRVLGYDRAGDAHYDHISAFIKSMRGSDPDAAVYWLVRMLEAGEDPRYIARRMVIHAAEDVGLADPMALVVATAAAQAVEFVGLPEAQIPMAEAAIYIATAPKSNAVVRALGAARRDVTEERADPVPLHLRDTSHPEARRRLGYGAGYSYAHDFPGGFVPQQYLPEALKDRIYYEPGGEGREAEIARRLREWWKGIKRYRPE
ncbi:MAG: replication-associated recombination protein A [Armatimonadota bacterium]|nr:replication-associated recombination protein A [Armatimonadota bacterium]MDR7451906.1 replication-associated recombination protein A [Armatimonadota bacterium]MDR7466588.1 replication-associated recombination protein A [Armatimonadota bacterium]MDR7495090.1 replication-associated recombination protein A [Armatimonadota bacterium]MDR7500164.1 replication-associated recombination protein A [Armatimonadota bacterium]